MGTGEEMVEQFFFLFFFSDKESVPGSLKPAGRSDRIPSLCLRIVIFLKTPTVSGLKYDPCVRAPKSL